MVSETPPRHSKSKAEPVTIDLDAKDVKAIDAGNKTAETAKKTAVTPDPKSVAAAGESNPTPVWDKSPEKTSDKANKIPIEPEPNVQKAEENQPPVAKPDVKPATDTPLKPASDKPAASASAYSSASSTSGVKETVSPKAATDKPFATAAKSSSTASSSQPATRKEAPTSGLIAAGIVGGIIALAAAGSMQYAGYLPPFSAGSTQNDTITADIASLREQISKAPTATADTSALEQRIAALESGTGTSGGDTAALSEKIASLESTIATLQSERSAQAEATSGLTRRLEAAETKINEPRDDVEVARAIASAALKSAIDRGGPFLTELDTLSRVSQDDPAIASLRPFAATGVPARAELMRDYPDVANAMLAALNQPDPSQGIFERLSESALSLVKVRPVGNIEGESPDAIVARMENKLRNGDLQGAALEWNALPEPAKSVSMDYKKSLDARIEVENLVSGTLNRAITATGKQG